MKNEYDTGFTDGYATTLKCMFDACAAAIDEGSTVIDEGIKKQATIVGKKGYAKGRDCAREDLFKQMLAEYVFLRDRLNNYSVPYLTAGR